MSMTRRWSLLTAVLIVGILAASWFLLVAPKRSQASELRGKATEQQATNAGLVLKLNELKAQSLDLPKQKAQLAVMRKQIPDNPALPTLIRDLTAAGKKVGVQVLSMKPGTPIRRAAPVVAAAAPATTTSGTDTTTSDGTAAAGTTPAAAAPVGALALRRPARAGHHGQLLRGRAVHQQARGHAAELPAHGIHPEASASTTRNRQPLRPRTTPGLDPSLTGQVYLSPNVAASTPAAAPVAAQ